MIFLSEEVEVPKSDTIYLAIHPFPEMPNASYDSRINKFFSETIDPVVSFIDSEDSSVWEINKVLRLNSDNRYFLATFESEPLPYIGWDRAIDNIKRFGALEHVLVGAYLDDHTGKNRCVDTAFEELKGKLSDLSIDRDLCFLAGW